MNTWCKVFAVLLVFSCIAALVSRSLVPSSISRPIHPRPPEYQSLASDRYAHDMRIYELEMARFTTEKEKADRNDRNIRLAWMMNTVCWGIAGGCGILLLLGIVVALYSKKKTPEPNSPAPPSPSSA